MCCSEQEWFIFKAGLQLINTAPRWLQNPSQHKRKASAAAARCGSSHCHFHGVRLCRCSALLAGYNSPQTSTDSTDTLSLLSGDSERRCLFTYQLISELTRTVHSNPIHLKDERQPIKMPLSRRRYLLDGSFPKLLLLVSASGKTPNFKFVSKALLGPINFNTVRDFSAGETDLTLDPWLVEFNSTDNERSWALLFMKVK